MLKIVTHPLFNKCKRILDSYETIEQKNTAINYVILAAKQAAKDQYGSRYNIDLLSKILYYKKRFIRYLGITEIT